MTHEELQDLLNQDISVPQQPTADPSWDYYNHHQELLKIRATLDGLTDLISQCEYASDATDEIYLEGIDRLIIELQEAKDLE